VPMGGMLGGGSSINFMMYTRAQGIDFDSWNTEGWAAKDMIPLCKKLETYHPEGEDIDQNDHGHDGPIHISDGGFRSKSENQFMETVEKMGYKTIVDLQDFVANDAFSVSLRLEFMDGKGDAD
jgi:alcohol oxidase